MKRRHLGVLGGVTAALLIGAAIAPAMAADEVETVVVTAQKRAQDMQQVPASLSVMSADDIVNAGINRFEDFAATLPNVFIDERNLRTTAISIRGIVSETNNPGVDQAVGVFVDGVYMGRPTMINTPLYDIERVEVVRGPQGTLYGKNTIAGAINVITALPGDRPDLTAAVTGGDYGEFLANAAIGGPVSDKFGVRVSGTYETRDGFETNTATGTKMDNVNSASARFAAKYSPTEDLQLIFRADVARDRTHSGAADILDNGLLAGSPFADASPTDRKIAENSDPVQNRDVWGTSLEADWDAGPGTLTSITAYRAYQWHNFADNDFTVLNLLGSGIAEYQHQFSQEVRFASHSGGRFEYLVGAYYFRQQLDSLAVATAGPDLALFFPGFPYTTNENIAKVGNVTTDNYAIFGQLTYNVTDALSVTAGLRYSNEDKTLVSSTTADPYQIFATNVPQRRLTMSEDNLSPSVNAVYRFNDHVRAYATYARGYKSGGFNAFSVTTTDDARYKAEKVDNYEAGIKSELFHRRLLLDASIFQMNYQDLQVNQLVTVGGVPQFVTSNAAKARTRGLELQATAQPLEWLGVTLGYGYLDAKFTDYRNADTSGSDYTGHHMVKAPRESFSLSALVQHALADGLRVTFRPEMTYRSRFFFDAANRYSQGAVALVNTRLGIGAQDGKWEATFGVHNLFDTDYAIDKFTGPIVPGQVVQSLGAPRTFTVEFRTKLW